MRGISKHWINRRQALSADRGTQAGHDRGEARVAPDPVQHPQKPPRPGNTPYSELLQTSDGTFYGTTFYGGSGPCPTHSTGGVLGCGTVFRMTPRGKVPALYSFPYDTSTGTSANGAFPTAGVILWADGDPSQQATFRPACRWL